MAFITLDFSCHDCELTEERFIDRTEENQQRCFECGQLITKDFPSPIGFVKGPSAGRRSNFAFNRIKTNKDKDSN